MGGLVKRQTTEFRLYVKGQTFGVGGIGEEREEEGKAVRG